MLSVAVPASFSGRGKFDGADVVMDGFGAGGGATWRGLSRKLDTHGSGNTRYGKRKGVKWHR